MGNGNAKWAASAVANKKSPNSVDRHVGARIRMRRVMLTLSQTQLGNALGLTFQQVQKYEKGTNRIGASRLQHIANVLKVPPQFFFDDAPTGKGGNAAGSDPQVNQFLSSRDGLALVTAYMTIKDKAVRKR